MRIKQAGLSYIEVLVATILITLTLVPMMEALKPGMEAGNLHREQSARRFALQGQLESLLAEPFGTLDAAATAAGSATTPTTYSDTAAAIPYEVFIWRYDADNADADDDVFTGGEDDLLWIRIASADGSFSLQTLRSPY